MRSPAAEKAAKVSDRSVPKVVNLNKFRKRKTKLEREKRADINRRLHGRTKAERARDALQKRQIEAKLAGALLGKPATDPGEES